MKNITPIINALKLIIKYSAYVIVIVDVVNFAIERFESLAEKEKPIETKKEPLKDN